MACKKTIVCLANSRKHAGRCIAGKEYVDGEFGAWVRPVSARASREIAEEDRRYENGIRASLLDVVTIPMLKHQPKDYQVENYLIDADQYWVKGTALKWDDLGDAADAVEGSLWGNDSSSMYGFHDRVALTDAVKLNNSLVLIEPSDLLIVVGKEGGYVAPAKRTVRANFRLNKHEYRLKVTDPKVEQQYLQQANGSYHIEEALLCVSRGEPFNDYAYKLVAAVLTPE